MRGHPGDFDNWEAKGAKGWSFSDVEYAFERLKEVSPTNEAAIDGEGRGKGRPDRSGHPFARASLFAAIRDRCDTYRHARGGLQWQRKVSGGRRVITGVDQHTGWKAFQHLSRLSEERGREPAQSNYHH